VHVSYDDLFLQAGSLHVRIRRDASEQVNSALFHAYK